MLATLRHFIRLTRAWSIMRRYFVVNGFDGVLTMLGLTMGFRISGQVAVADAATACLGAAIALAASGVSSAYISEAAERRRELQELEQAMIMRLDQSEPGRAARLIPVLVALVNGVAPLFFSLIIIIPLWLDMLGVSLPASPFDLALGTAFLLMFLLGVFLGRVGGYSRLRAGLRALLVGTVTAGLILLIAG